MDPRGEFAHSLRNPLAAVDANLRFLRELCRDLERGIAGPGDRVNPPELLREARAALDDSVQAVEQIRTRLRVWVEDAR